MKRKKIAGISLGHQNRGSGLLRIIAILACLSVSTAAYCQDKILDVGALPNQTKTVLASLKAGVTRADVERECKMDGGISVPFYSERYIVPGYPEYKKSVMVDIQFKPVGVPDDVYKDPQRFRDWWTAHLKFPPWSGNDVVVSVSPPYLQFESGD